MFGDFPRSPLTGDLRFAAASPCGLPLRRGASWNADRGLLIVCTLCTFGDGVRLFAGLRLCSVGLRRCRSELCWSAAGLLRRSAVLQSAAIAWLPLTGRDADIDRKRRPRLALEPKTLEGHVRAGERIFSRGTARALVHHGGRSVTRCRIHRAGHAQAHGEHVQPGDLHGAWRRAARTPGARGAPRERPSAHRQTHGRAQSAASP